MKNKISLFEQRFKHRYMLKKKVNLMICALIVILGCLSILYILDYDRDGVLTFRWMTVDGTVFTTLISLFYLAVGLWEIRNYTELTRETVYYMRLSSAVAESMIIFVVLVSRLPFSPEHMHIFRFDMFNMHILIPLLTVASFIMNDSPIGKTSMRQRFHGTWFVTFYVIIMISLITSGVIKADKIPYFFLDIDNMNALEFTGYFIMTYIIAYSLSYILYRLNLKCSWLWFKKRRAKT